MTAGSSAAKMTRFLSGTRKQPENSEIAAAIAAVHAYVDAECAEARLPAAPAQASSNWQRAAFLEGTGSPSVRSLGCLTKAFRTTVMTFLALAASVSLQALPAQADDNDGSEPIAIASASASASRPANRAPIVDSDQQENASRVLIKVAVALGKSSIDIDVPDGATIASLKTGATLAAMPPHSRWTIATNSNGALAFSGRASGDVAGINPDKTGDVENVSFLSGRAVPMQNSFVLPPEPNTAVAQAGETGYVVVPSGDDPGAALITCNGRLYRGCIWVRPTASGSTLLNAINVLDVEDYLMSVLPSEMPSQWSAEALKAQAIAARSYAIANLGKHGSDGYDLKATVEDQVYQGICSERVATNDAVSSTTGLVLKHRGKVVSAFFHSTSGGCTELSEHVWGRSLPYLRSVVDFDDNSPNFSWSRTVTNADMNAAFGKDVGRVTSITIRSRAPSGRVKEAVINGTTGSRTLTGGGLRLALKLPSSNFNVSCEQNSYSFAGRGSGHGLGMSQWGAKALADHGYNAAQILAYYYKDVSVEYVAGAPGI